VAESISSPALQSVLPELRDIYIPAPEAGFGISQDYGATLSVLVLGLVLAWLFRRHVLQSPRHIALKELNGIRRSHIGTKTTQRTLTEANALIRRLALALYPPQDVAGLTGKPWLAFLDRTGKSTFFVEGEGRALESGSFTRTVPEIDTIAFFVGLEHWVRAADAPHRRWRDKILRPVQGLPTLYPRSQGPPQG